MLSRRAHRAVAGSLAAFIMLMPALAVIDGAVDEHHYCAEHATVEHGTVELDADRSDVQTPGEQASLAPVTDESTPHESCLFASVFDRDDAVLPDTARPALASCPSSVVVLVTGQVDAPPIPVLSTAPKLPPPSVV